MRQQCPTTAVDRGLGLLDASVTSAPQGGGGGNGLSCLAAHRRLPAASHVTGHSCTREAEAASCSGRPQGWGGGGVGPPGPQRKDQQWGPISAAWHSSTSQPSTNFLWEEVTAVTSHDDHRAGSFPTSKRTWGSGASADTPAPSPWLHSAGLESLSPLPTLLH